MSADINSYFDPVCRFVWMNSKWVRQVRAQRDYTVDWRFVSLRLINADVDHDAHFPPEYEAGHTAGLRLLRVAERARAEHGREAIGLLYAAFGGHIFDTAPQPDGYRNESELRERRGTREFAEPIVAEAGLPLDLADAVDDESWDAEIRPETDEAFSLTGKDVGTPIIHFELPAGVAFFRAGDQPVAERGLGDRAVGSRGGAGTYPGFCRAQAQPARAATAGCIWSRCRHRRSAGGLARRQPAPEEVTARLEVGQ